MAYIQLPVRSDVPSFDFQQELEGVQYSFEFRYNQRANCWTMDILDANGVEIINGVKIVTGYPLLLFHKIEGRPPGEFFALDTAGENKSPVIDDFGQRVLFLYRESTTDDDAILAGA